MSHLCLSDILFLLRWNAVFGAALAGDIHDQGSVTERFYLGPSGRQRAVTW